MFKNMFLFHQMRGLLEHLDPYPDPHSEWGFWIQIQQLKKMNSDSDPDPPPCGEGAGGGPGPAAVRVRRLSPHVGHQVWRRHVRLPRLPSAIQGGWNSLEIDQSVQAFRSRVHSMRIPKKMWMN